jgi:general secretion pathway protein L
VVPGEQVTLHWLDLPAGLAPAQAQAAARLLAAEASAQPIADMHVAVGREGEGGLRPVALVPAAAMAEWLATLGDSGFEPDIMVPDTLLLPMPPDGFVRLALHDIALYRGPDAAFAMEPELGDLVVGEAPVAELDQAGYEAALADGLAVPLLLNLRQAAFARRREWRFQRARIRRLALLGAALAGVTLAIQLAQIMSYTFAADAAEEETRRIAASAMRGKAGATDADLRSRLAELRGGGVGFTAIAAAVFAAVKEAPNVELSALAFGADGSLRLTAQGDSPASLANLAGRIQAAGFAVEQAPPRSADGRQVQDMMVRPR